MKRIAFVDDDSSILDGMRRVLRPFKKEWDMHFFNSGADALEAFEEHEFDLIISDMRMPGMNGAQLLNRIKEISPSTIRIILSGFANEELTLESVHAAHQFITKPADAEKVRNCVQKAMALQEMLSSEEIKSFLGSIQSLPMLPVVYDELMREVASEEVSIRQVGRVVAKDIGLTSEVLKLVNSAFFGLRRHFESPEEATTYLGTDTIKNLALMTSVFHSFPATNQNLEKLQRLNQLSERVGLLAARLAGDTDLSQRSKDHCQVAGMMSGLGELIALSYGDRVSEESDLLKDRPLLGSYLLGIWSLPFPIIEAVRWHRHPEQSGVSEMAPLTVVHAAWAFLSDYTNEGELTLDSSNLNRDYLLETAGEERLNRWFQVASEFCELAEN